MNDLRAELAESLDEAEWEWLQPHALRDSLIVVEPQLDLLDVGVAIANDNTLSVQHWIAEHLIHKPSSREIATWEHSQGQRFTALIVQPYVLIQEM